MPRKLRLFFRYASPFILLALAVALVRLTGLADILNQAWMDEYIRGKGPVGWLLFLLICGLLSSFGTPRQIFAFLGGYVFGAGLGTVLSTLAATIGCAAIYAYSRRFGPAVAAEKLRRGRLARLDGFFREAPFLSTVIIRLLPIVNNALVNLFAGVTGIAFLPFLAGSCLGFVPQMLIFALLGDGLQVDGTGRLAISVALFLFSGLLGLVLYRRCRRAVQAARELEGERGD